MNASQLLSHGCRLMLLGSARAGKSTLLQAMQVGTSAKTHGYEPTAQLDCSQTLVIGSDVKQKIVSVWDFGGGVEHAAATMHYIVDGSLYVLAVPCEKMHVLRASTHDYVDRWLDYLDLYAPSAIVIPVLTKCDVALDKVDAASVQAGLDPSLRLKSAADDQLVWLLDAIEANRERAPRSTLTIQPPVATSAVSGGDVSLEVLRSQLETLVLAEKPPLPTIGQGVPRAMFLTMVFLRALRDGRDPVDSGRAADLGYIPSAMSTDPKSTRWYMPYAEVHHAYVEEFMPALKVSVTSESALKDIIDLLAASGEIVWAPGNGIYLRPDYISRLVAPLVDTRMGSRLWQPNRLRVAEAYRTTILNAPMCDAERNAALLASECLAATAELREELLPVLWEPLGVRRNDYDDTLRVLCSAGIYMYTSIHSQTQIHVRIHVHIPRHAAGAVLGRAAGAHREHPRRPPVAHASTAASTRRVGAADDVAGGDRSQNEAPH